MHGFPMLETMQKLMDDEGKERKKLEKEPLEPEEPQCEEVTKLIAAEQVTEDVAAEVQDAIPVEVAAKVQDAIPVEVATEVQDAIPAAEPKVKPE